MESSIAVFLSRQPACERLPTSNVGWGGFWFGPRWPCACARVPRLSLPQCRFRTLLAPPLQGLMRRMLCG